MTMSPVQMCRLFLTIGTMAFGGLGATLALIERDLIERRQLLTRADLAEALTYTKFLPGSTGPQVVAYLGYKLGGWPGSALATIAFVLPSATAMLALAAGYAAVVETLPGMTEAIRGLVAAVIGILLATTYRLGKSNIKEPVTLVIALAAFVAGAFAGVNAAFVVLAAGSAGIAFFARASGTEWASAEGQR